MTPCKPYCMLSFGFTEKTVKRDHLFIGLCGFKPGSVWLGKDAFIFTRLEGLSAWCCFSRCAWTVSMLRLIIPLMVFNQQNKKMIVTEDSVPSLDVILDHTFFNTREELLAQFDAVSGKKGMHILIWNWGWGVR
ncbi:MORC family CW-type zinc finger protein 4 [Tyto alba]|uniref:MORC family CW-type zinc finger protein 4 n=1 Tax=Tyto alba TaxID=56313 RepID=UPI001402CE09|nr:MORC family CW-type zinc finger protein 4 [Tyto alba]